MNAFCNYLLVLGTCTCKLEDKVASDKGRHHGVVFGVGFCMYNLLPSWLAEDDCAGAPFVDAFVSFGLVAAILGTMWPHRARGRVLAHGALPRLSL